VHLFQESVCFGYDNNYLESIFFKLKKLFITQGTETLFKGGDAIIQKFLNSLSIIALTNTETFFE
jgi:hypothetical protein